MSATIEGGNLLVEADGVLNVLPVRGVPVWRKLLGLASDLDAVAAMLTARDNGAVDGEGRTAWGLAWQALREAALNECGVEAPDPDLPGILPQDVDGGQGQTPVNEFIHGPKWAEQVAKLEANEAETRVAVLAAVDQVESKRQQAREMLGLEFAAETRAATLSADVTRVPVFGTAARQALEAEGVEPLAAATPVIRAATLTATVEPTLPLPDGVDLADLQAALNEAANLIDAAEQDFDRSLLADIWSVKNREPEPGPRSETEGVRSES